MLGPQSQVMEAYVEECKGKRGVELEKWAAKVKPAQLEDWRTEGALELESWIAAPCSAPAVYHPKLTSVRGRRSMVDINVPMRPKIVASSVA